MEDTAVPHHYRAGAHRARRHPLRRTTLWLVSVAAVAGVLVWLLLSLDVLGLQDELVDSPEGAGVALQPDAEPSLPVDRDIGVQVLNGTSTAGLASGAADELVEAGWTVERVADHEQAQDVTTVLFGSPGLEATATAVAAELGGVPTGQSGEWGDEAVAVVLGSDYAG